MKIFTLFMPFYLLSDLNQLRLINRHFTGVGVNLMPY